MFAWRSGLKSHTQRIRIQIPIRFTQMMDLNLSLRDSNLNEEKAKLKAKDSNPYQKDLIPSMNNKGRKWSWIQIPYTIIRIHEPGVMKNMQQIRILARKIWIPLWYKIQILEKRFESHKDGFESPFYKSIKCMICNSNNSKFQKQSLSQRLVNAFNNHKW